MNHPAVRKETNKIFLIFHWVDVNAWQESNRLVALAFLGYNLETWTVLSRIQLMRMGCWDLCVLLQFEDVMLFSTPAANAQPVGS